MTYKLKEKPKMVYSLETKQFTIVDEEGREYEIRISDSSKNTEWFMWHEPGGWDEIGDVSILDYLEEGFGEDEWDFEREESKKINEKMDLKTEEFIKENGEIKDLNQVDSLISNLMTETDYSKKYGERFYDSYNYVRNYLRNKEKESQ
jgi:hypothetical protein